MALMPVVTREMSALARRQSTYRARSLTAVVAVLTMLWLLLVSASRVTFGNLGQSIFFMLSLFSFVFALLVGMQATADSVSEEKREGTLGLLFLTDLRPMHIVLGKMAASSLNAFFAVMGVVPMLALALLIGGVTLPQIALVAVVLLNTMFLSLSMGLFVSTLSKNERKAMLACFVGLFLVAIAPFILSAILNNFEKPLEEVIWPSPIYTFLLIQDNSPSSTFSERYLAIGLIWQHLLGWLLLWFASRYLPKTVNELPAKRFVRLRTAINNYVFGNEQTRKQHRALLLDRNAFLWLASRERVKPKYAWLVTGFFGLLFLWVFLQFPDMFFDPPVPLMIIFLVHLIFKLWTASEVCSRLIQDRRSGALELLLSTPLSVREIVEGQSLALRRIFRRPLIVLIIAELVIVVLTWQHAREEAARQSVILFGAAISTLLLDLWALKWVGLWLSLFGKSIERILIATLARIMAVPAILVFVIVGSVSAIVALQGETVPAAFSYFAYWGISLVCSLLFGAVAKRSFLLNFREAATQRFDSSVSRAEHPVRRRKVAPSKEPFWRASVAAMRRHWVITGSVTLVGVLLLIPLSRRLYWQHQVAIEMRAVRTQGPAGAPEIARFYTPVPSSENGFQELMRLGAINRRRGLPAVFSTQWFLRAKSNAVPVFDECRQLVSSNQPNLDAFRHLTNFSKAYIDPEQISAWMLPVDLNGYISLGGADAFIAIRDNDANRLKSDFRGIMALARLLRSIPLTLIQNYCRDAIAVLDSALEAAFARDLLRDDDLRQMQVELEAIESAKMLPDVLLVERARVIDRWGRVESPPFGGPPPTAVQMGSAFLSMTGTTDESLTRVLRAFRKTMEGSASPPHLILASHVVYPTTPQLWLRFFQPWNNPSVPDLPSIVFNEAMLRARIELTRAAIAARRFEIANHTLPTTLQELVPKYLEAPPVDSTTGARLEAELSNDVLLIHSRQVNPPNLSRRTWNPQDLVFELRPIPLEKSSNRAGE